MERKREEGIFEILATLPWWTGVVVAFFVYVFLSSMLPTLVGSNAILKAIAQGLRSSAWIFACLFLIPAPVALINALRRRRLLNSQTGIAAIRSMSWRNFERLVGEAFRRQGLSVEERGGSAADDGEELARMVAAVQEERRVERAAGRGFTPSRQRFVFGKICPICGEAMVKRIATRGPSAGASFWGCSRFPTCRGTLPDAGLESRGNSPTRHPARRIRPTAGGMVEARSSLSRRPGARLANKSDMAHASVSGAPMPPSSCRLPRTSPASPRVAAGNRRAKRNH